MKELPLFFQKRKSRAAMGSSLDAWLDNTYCEISPVFTWTFWLSFPVWSVTLIFAERLGSPMISIFLVGVSSVWRVSTTNRIHVIMVKVKRTETLCQAD